MGIFFPSEQITSRQGDVSCVGLRRQVPMVKFIEFRFAQGKVSLAWSSYRHPH